MADQTHLARFNPAVVEEALAPAETFAPFPRATDRATWKALRESLDERQLRLLLNDARAFVGEPVPPLPATLYLDFARTGRREGYEAPRNRRREMLATLVLAECMTAEAEFLDAILNLAWAICEESSWALPAHQRTLADAVQPVLDLGAAMTALDLAEAVHLLDDRLDPLLVARVHAEIRRRCLDPYLARHDFWWLHSSAERGVNNWNAVCNAGVVGAALYVEQEPARLAEIIARAARSLDDYLATFDQDGGSSEGPGYWDYGFGYYTVLADLVAHRTHGRINLLEGEWLRRIAAYPLRTLLSPGAYVNFSDCDSSVRYSRALLAYLAGRLELRELAALARQQPAGPRPTGMTWSLRDLCWTLPPDTPDGFTPARHDWFGGMMWMVARADPADPQALVLAAKGGHNGEMHNQNDVGNIIVHCGGESLVADVGRGRYTDAYFGPQRYDYFVNSSLGHSVPVVNGALQEPGAVHAAVLLDHQAAPDHDSLALDLTGLYGADADLKRLHRRVTLHREEPHGWVELEDQIEFARQPGRLESVLITLGQVELGDGGLVIHGERGALRVTYDADALLVALDVISDVDLPRGAVTVHRIVFTHHAPIQSGFIRLELVPVPGHSA